VSEDEPEVLESWGWWRNPGQPPSHEYVLGVVSEAWSWPRGHIRWSTTTKGELVGTVKATMDGVVLGEFDTVKDALAVFAVDGCK
jgi:hypothetical protein